MGNNGPLDLLEGIFNVYPDNLGPGGDQHAYTPLTQAGWRAHWDAAGLLLKAGATCQKADLVGDWLYSECSKRH